LRKFLKEKKPVLIFTPTIDESETLFRVLNLFVKNGNFVNSTSLNRNKIISDFKKNKYKFLVTTSVLERGVTIDNLQVIIFNADSKIYDDMALVQISGRVGRKAPHPFGDVIYIAGKRNLAIENSIRTLKECNDAV
jgi:competence protein ComFA